MSRMILAQRLLRAHRKIELYPITLVPIIVLYGLLTYGAAHFSGRAGIFTARILWSVVLPSKTHPHLDYQLARLLFYSLFVVIWAHYAFMLTRCFVAASKVGASASAVAQLVAVTVIVFAVAHYLVALFSDAVDYNGIANPRPAGGWGFLRAIEDRIFFIPKTETAFDFLYFSVVTTATVGYGDIYPKSLAAKAVTMLQIAVSFVLIVVILAWTVGKAKGLGDATRASDAEQSKNLEDQDRLR